MTYRAKIHTKGTETEIRVDGTHRHARRNSEYGQ